MRSLSWAILAGILGLAVSSADAGDVVEAAERLLREGVPRHECAPGEVGRNYGSKELPWWSCVRVEAPGLVTECRPGSHGCSLRLEGEITQAQAVAVRRVLSQPKPEPLGFSLAVNSPGGDVAAAIEIGRALREANASIEVMHNAVCASACVLVLAGAVERNRYGTVIIHRPYRISTEPMGDDGVQRSYATRRDAVREYLAAMNVSESLWDAMNAVPPEQDRVLSEQELDAYGLTRFDPAYEEERNARNARALGISMPEYLQRKKAQHRCLEETYARYTDPATPEAIAAGAQCRTRYPTTTLDARRK